MPFGDVLRKLRKQNKLTQSQLGKVFGIAESTVGMYERGQREPSFEMLEEIADYFNVDMDYLTGRSSIQRKVSFPSGQEVMNLTQNEQLLISGFRQLNKDGQEYIMQTLDMAIPKYGVRFQEDQRSTNAG